MQKNRLSNIIFKMADEPFRLFFPLGAALSILGVIYWPFKLSGTGFLAVSPKFHVWVQIYGFMFSFIIGFLATAIPRLRGAAHFRVFEVGILFVLEILIVGAFLAGKQLAGHILFFSLLVCFLFFLSKRINLKNARPFPETFIFIPFGFLAVIVGNILMILLSSNLFWNAKLHLVSCGLMFEGLTLFMLLGVGGFLIKSILGWGPLLPPREGNSLEIPESERKKIVIHGLCAAGIFASFFIEIYIHGVAGRLLRALLVSFELFGQIRIHKVSTSSKLSSLWLRLSLWLLFAGLWGNAIFIPRFRLSFLHLCFMAGFSLSAFAVASRVIFAHCNYPERLKGHYLPFDISGWIILIALASRFVADIFPKSYGSHLYWAGVMWTAGVLTWSIFVLSDCIRDTFRGELLKIDESPHSKGLEGKHV